ncbi:sigma-70 family RNA polymerase sigma factor [Catelliglobosispora koreensis]|uniref:sigma-70 family RNA polymerase sigma factor n=1 Tax=Catelliglobosispora koreensis TaxID=129052 RepID=UPI000475C884|nr:sigma-70 family RNA polymerase sigma factor [Catelliglobosispora koreensis]
MSELDDDLVARAQHGDAAALEQLLGAVRVVAVRYCRARLGRTVGAFTTADDLAQEICLAVFHGLARVRGPLITYMYGIASHKVTDALRTAGRTAVLHSLDELEGRADISPGPEDAAVAAELSAQLARLLATLPPQHREIIVLRIMVGLPAEQVGAALNLSAANVRLIQHRALAQLRPVANEILSEVNP